MYGAESHLNTSNKSQWMKSHSTGISWDACCLMWQQAALKLKCAWHYVNVFFKMDEYQSNFACSCNYLTTCYKYNYVLSGGCTDNHVYVHVAICMIEYVESMTI